MPRLRRSVIQISNRVGILTASVRVQGQKLVISSKAQCAGLISARPQRRRKAEIARGRRRAQKLTRA
jgi:hypothetical protein